MEHISMSEPRPLDRSGLTQTRLEYVMKLFSERRKYVYGFLAVILVTNNLKNCIVNFLNPQNAFYI